MVLFRKILFQLLLIQLRSVRINISTSHNLLTQQYALRICTFLSQFVILRIVSFFLRPLVIMSIITATIFGTDMFFENFLKLTSTCLFEPWLQNNTSLCLLRGHPTFVFSFPSAVLATSLLVWISSSRPVRTCGSTIPSLLTCNASSCSLVFSNDLPMYVSYSLVRFVR